MSKARQLADLGNVYDDGALSNRNLIINGAMQVWQRGTAATSVGTGYRNVDRYYFYKSSSGDATVERSTDAPDGFAYSMKLAVTTADTSISSGEYFEFGSRLEGQNFQHLAYGTDAAKTLTISFWVKSSKAGTYSVNILKRSSTRYHYIKMFTIDAADTWEKKVVVVPPDSNIKSSSGVIDNNADLEFELLFNLMLGSTYTVGTDEEWNTDTNAYATTDQVNWMDSTSNNFYLTGVQLEIGDTATPFEHRSYGDELQRCMRYYEEWVAVNGENVVMGTAYSGTNPHAVLQMKVIKRANPTVTLPPAGQTSGSISFLTANGGSPSTTGSHGVDRLNTRSVRVTSSGYSGLNSGDVSAIYAYGGGQSFKFDSEL